MSVFDEVSILVRDANPGRQAANIRRRAMKLMEELGEIAQAWLNVTSPSNGKGKTWDDVREEIADCLIVALDVGWTVLPTEVEVPTITFPTFPMPVAFNDAMVFDTCWYLGKFGRDFVRSHITQVIEHVQVMTLCAFPDQLDASMEQIESQLLIEVKRKLAKWSANRATMAVVTDDV